MAETGIPAGARLDDVVVLAPEGVAAFELGVLCEVFGTDRTGDGFPPYRFALASDRPGQVQTGSGFSITVAEGLDRLEAADLVAMPAYRTAAAEPGGRLPDPMLEAIVAAHARGAMVMSVCSGAFGLGLAGLLDGRRCTTHWQYTDALRRRFPLAHIQPDVLYVGDAGVLTSAGTAAGIDLCLHLVREIQGSEVANALARRMVVPPHRDGGQAQFIDVPMPAPTSGSLSASISGLLDWMSAHLDVELTVEELAARAHMSARTFARRFKAETGTTPHRWLVVQRVLRAQQLLESSDEPIERVAELAGFGNAATLRHHFGLVRGTTPQAFRRTFRVAG
ncbi:MAG: helix-turn-helix domain-containing protein [Actinomycetales bacterium]